MANILLAEDERVTVALFERYLIRMGHTVVGIADSVEQVLIQARQHKPDYILMDINLKYRTAGIEACKAVKKEHPDIKVIFVSAYEEFMFENELKDCVYEAFVDKYLFEFKIEELLK